MGEGLGTIPLTLQPSASVRFNTKEHSVGGTVDGRIEGAVDEASSVDVGSPVDRGSPVDGGSAVDGGRPVDSDIAIDGDNVVDEAVSDDNCDDGVDDDDDAEPPGIVPNLVQTKQSLS